MRVSSCLVRRSARASARWSRSPEKVRAVTITPTPFDAVPELPPVPAGVRPTEQVADFRPLRTLGAWVVSLPCRSSCIADRRVALPDPGATE
jgi:hypothetical protein